MPVHVMFDTGYYVIWYVYMFSPPFIRDLVTAPGCMPEADLEFVDELFVMFILDKILIFI
jgi:hypothetical protein